MPCAGMILSARYEPLWRHGKAGATRSTRRHPMPRQRDKKKWVQNVKTVSTFPPEKLFTKDARTIARSLASKKISPKGIGSGIRMLQYFINRGGKGLSPTRKTVLERAKRMMQKMAKRKRQFEMTKGQ